MPILPSPRLPNVSATRCAVASHHAGSLHLGWTRGAALAAMLWTSIVWSQGPPAGVYPATGASVPASPGYRPAEQARPPQGIFLNRPQFEIPFSVAKIGIQPQEVHLYMSRDAGARWELFARQPAGSQSFPFSAPADGDYWFATRTIDVSGAAHPAGPVQPQLRVTVDTANPELEARADADGNGQVIVDYRIADLAPLAESLRIEYMTDSVRQWMPVRNASQPLFREQQGVAEGRIVWVPESDWRHVYIRLIVRDRADNQTVLTRQVEKPRVAQQELPTHLASTPLLTPPPPPNDAPPVYGNPAALAAIAAAGQQANGPLTGRPESHPLVNQPFNPVYRQPEPQDAADPRTAYAPYPANNSAPPQTGYGQPVAPAPAEPRYASNSPNLPPYESGAAAPSQWQATPSTPQGAAGAMRMAQAGGAGYGSTGDLSLNSPTSLNSGSSAIQPEVPAQNPYVAAPQSRRAEDALRPMAPEVVPTPPATPDTLTTTPAPRHAPVQSPDRIAPAPYENDSPGQENVGAPTSSVPPPGWPTPTAPSVARPATPPMQQSRRVSVADTIPSGATVRHSDSRTFSLDYELESIGRKGVDTVELWATKDLGRTWDYWDADPDGQSPFDIITSGDGVYGFRIVVVGRNGLTSPRPQAGEDADIYVMVDTSKPVARITGARYGDQDDTGKLLIQYECDDPLDNLARRPITLKFADSPDGPWTTIATGLDNDGFYAWPADPELPAKIYLRIEAVDRAGNIGAETLTQPIAVEGLAPRARIRGFQSVRDEEEGVPAARFK